ncbi:MAG: hypothetical protein ACYTAN_02140 [Planctomycetota bacterium]
MAACSPNEDRPFSEAVRDLIGKSQEKHRTDPAAHIANLEAGTLAFLDALKDHVEKTHGYVLQARILWDRSDTRVDQQFLDEVQALIADAKSRKAEIDSPVTYGVEILRGLYCLDRARAIASNRANDTTN